MNVEDAAKLFDRRVRAWLDQDIDAYLECWHDDMVITVPGRGAAIVGVSAYRALVERSFAWAQPLSFDVHHLSLANGDDDVLLAEWTLRARRRDDGVTVEWSGMSVCGVRDGRISWWREYHRSPPAPVDG